MIKITNLNKYYNKGKTNELHVINNVSLELNNTGLVAFLGKSGSGKTTLLNIIGGLDKQDSGQISYDNTTYSKYNMHEVDIYRKENVGYIFQNYLLLDNMTVMDNLREALEIIGINNKEEQKKRIEYALKAVGLFKYRKKLTKNLSGGEMQRVSIARSLIKNCKLIIADEPTGNLDRENTLEIMNILKKISQKTLVLLVTHNEEMAEAFAQRIIKIKDGTIIDDYINAESGKIHDKSTNNIYLKDLNHQILENENISIDVYQENDEKIKLKLFIKNDTIYFQTNHKINNINNTDINLIDDHYQEEIKIDNKNYQFDISWFNNNKENSFWQSFTNNLKNAWKHFRNTTKKGKIFHFIFFLIGIIIASCIISYTNYLAKDNNFEDVDTYVIYQNSYMLTYPNISGLNQKELIKNDYISDIYAYESFSFNIEKSLNSSIKTYYMIEAHLHPFSLVKNDKFITGSKPIYQDEILISKNIADLIIEKELLNNYNDLLGRTIKNLTITGVINDNNNAFYTPDAYYLNTIITIYNLRNEWYDTSRSVFYVGSENEFTYEITNGSKELTNDDEILIASDIANYYNLNVNDVISFSWQDTTTDYNKAYKIGGIFKSSQTNQKYGFITKDLLLRGYNINLATLNQENFTGFNDCIKSNYQQIINNKYLVINLDDIKDDANYGFNITKGKLPIFDNEILVSEHYDVPIGKTLTIDNQEYKIVGTYQVKNGLDNLAFIIAKDKTYLQLLVNWVEKLVIEYGFNPSFQVKNLNELTTYLKEKDFSVSTIYDYQSKIETISTKNKKNSLLLTTIVLAIVCVVYIYFSTKSSIFSEVKNIGVYRSIGKTRLQIAKSYIANIFIQSSFTSLLGYILTIIVVSYFNLKIINILGTSLISMNFGIYLIGIIVLYLINIIVGLIPVLRLMKNTPSEINSKYDV